LLCSYDAAKRPIVSDAPSWFKKHANAHAPFLSICKFYGSAVIAAPVFGQVVGIRLPVLRP
jgi:hypothetical protein